MKVTLVFPPNHNIPHGPYGGLSLLAGCLGEAGHDVDILDANLEAFEQLVKREVLEMHRGYFEKAWSGLRSLEKLTPGQARQFQGLATLNVFPIEKFYGAERAVEILRTRELLLQPELANWAYDLLANFTRMVYAINPIFYPLAETYTDDFFGYLAQNNVNPISQINEEVIIPDLLAKGPEMVAVSIPFNEQTTEAFAFLKQLKAKAPHVKTIVGGSIVSAFHGILTSDPRFFEYADYAMPGEADMSFPAFVTALENGTDLAEVPNLIYRDEGGKVHRPFKLSTPNLNDIAPPDFSRVPVDRYLLPNLVVNYQTSRGCYYGKCTFCSDDIKANFRFRKASLVIQDIERIKEQTGARHIMLWDPLTPPRLMRDISEWNCTFPEDERIYWAAETRFEQAFADPEYTARLYEGGARLLQFGYESGSQRVLDLMVKGNDLTHVHKVLECLRDTGIAVSVQWFIGFPTATEEEDLQSYRFLNEHRDGVLLSSYMGVYSISPYDDIFRSEGGMYDLELFQDEVGRWDFRHKDGTMHYDREELNAAMLSRGDAESVTRMGMYVYLTENPSQVREITGFESGGMLPESSTDLFGKKPRLPKSNHLQTYDFDVFTPPEQLGITEESPGPFPKVTCHALLVTQTQQVHPLNEWDWKLVHLADGTRTTEKLVEEMGGDPKVALERLFFFVRRGVLVVPHVRSAVGSMSAASA